MVSLEYLLFYCSIIILTYTQNIHVKLKKKDDAKKPKEANKACG